MAENLALKFFRIIERSPFVCFTLLSLALSTWASYADNVINNDGVLYLSAASFFAEGRWSEALAIYPLPAYSMLIGFLIAITGLDASIAAQILNAALDAGTAVLFVLIVKTLGVGPRGLIAAGAMVVCHLWVNDMRATIIRDHGYLTLYLLATYFFVKDHVSPQAKLKSACLVAFLLSTMFRIEGMVFFAFVAVYYGYQLAKTRTQRLIIVLFSLIALIFLPVAAAFWKAGFFEYLAITKFEWTLDSITSNIDRLFTGEISFRVDRIRTDILPEYSQRYGWPVYIGAVIAILVAGIIKSVTFLYGPMAVYAFYNRHILPAANLVRPLLWLVFTNVILLFIFVFLSLFIDWRYGTALSLTLTLFATFTLIEAYRYWWNADAKRKTKNIIVPAILVTLVIALAIDGLPSPSRYSHVKTAAQWIRENTEDRHAVVSNSSVLMYYAGRWERLSGPRTGYELDPTSGYWINNADTESRNFLDFDYIAIEIRRGATEIDKILLDQFNSRLVATFENNRGERVSILKTIKP